MLILHVVFGSVRALDISFGANSSTVEVHGDMHWNLGGLHVSVDNV